ncbi:hypothetical protein GOP47_0026083 [Adiantum capillus-veneris]|uniref:Uncharacterized protein n=1 Tax=Adiantum capillus-veneris TaxID=13818 RepID=A0A9D4U1F7_ADICA|nr:hypothetical protein GOP47_0026083 [Adiantum capillus-veneris]
MSAVLSSLTSHPVLPTTGESVATRVPIVVDMEHDEGMDNEQLVLQIEINSQQVIACYLYKPLWQKNLGDISGYLYKPLWQKNSHQSRSGQWIHLHTLSLSQCTPRLDSTKKYFL